jgi:hypothetical protein
MWMLRESRNDGSVYSELRGIMGGKYLFFLLIDDIVKADNAQAIILAILGKSGTSSRM